MSKLVWDRPKNRKFETGVDHGVLYLQNSQGVCTDGVAWNGLISVSENPSGGEPTAMWADNVKYLNLMSAEEFGCTIEAYSYPRAFLPCLGKAEPSLGLRLAQQRRKPFGFSFRTLVGNAEEGTNYGSRIHAIYGCMASPSEQTYSTVNDSPEATTLSWEVTTTPVVVEGYKPTSEFVFDELKFKNSGAMNAFHMIEDVLYGTEDTEAKLPTLDEVTEIYSYARFIMDNDGDELIDSNGNKMQSAVYN